MYVTYGGIGQNLHCMMMQYSLHHASTMHLKMRSNGPHLRKDLVWVCIYRKYQGVLSLLMAFLIEIHKPRQNEAHGT
jgi:hypothetical protein